MFQQSGFVLFLFCFAGSTQLEVRLMPASHCFEVSGNGNLAVSGKWTTLAVLAYYEEFYAVYIWALTALGLYIVSVRENLPFGRNCYK